MSDHHKTWIEAALNDLETAIYLHQGGFWFQATLSAQQAGEKLGKSILIFSGTGDVQSYSHRISRINKKIQELGLHSFSEADDHIANDMQLTYVNHPGINAGAFKTKGLKLKFTSLSRDL